MTKKKRQTPLWSGRFRQEPAAVLQRYTSSLHLDRRLAVYDIRGSVAHVNMLARQGILSEQDREKILEALHQIRQEVESGQFRFREELEDVHMNIEARLHELAGEAGQRIHAGRSRNDQVLVDMKMFCLDTAAAWQLALVEILQVLLDRAQGLTRSLFPGWTHLQTAQPVSWAHYLLAFGEMFGRDLRRLAAYRQLHSYSPLGAGALAGSTLPLDPDQTASELGFDSPFTNSYDVVGDRDFILELLQISAQLMIHVSRLAEDFIYFSSTPVDWIELPDELCTGSSIMPQKKNPDLLELARGKCASVVGHSHAIATLLKGLPTSYHRDLQQDKEHLFSAADVVTETLEMIPLILAGVQIKEERCRAALEQGYVMATDLAEYLVEKGVPFRRAHQKVGELVAVCLDQGKKLQELALDELRRVIPDCGRDVKKILKPESVLHRRRHRGTTGLASVKEQILRRRQWLQQQRKSLSQPKHPGDTCAE